MVYRFEPRSTKSKTLIDQVEVLEFYSRYNKVEYPQEPKEYSNQQSNRHFFSTFKGLFLFAYINIQLDIVNLLFKLDV